MTLEYHRFPKPENSPQAKNMGWKIWNRWPKFGDRPPAATVNLGLTFGQREYMPGRARDLQTGGVGAGTIGLSQEKNYYRSALRLR